MRQVRAPLLLVPPSMAPLAVLLATLGGYVGEFFGPLIAGTIKDWYAPHCAVIDTGGGVRALDPRCASDDDQRGLLYVLVATQVFAVGAGATWIAGGYACKAAARPVNWKPQ